MTNKTIVIYSLLFFSSINGFGQTDCGTKQEKDKFQCIFGIDRLYEYGPDTLITNTGRQVIYFCDSCAIKGYDKNGKLKWTKDLHEFKCSLRVFTFFNCKTGGRIKGGDILTQFKDNKMYSLNSKSGKMKFMSEFDFRKKQAKLDWGDKMKQ